MKFLKHPATIIATVALFIAMGGGAAAYASGLINGAKIKNHSIAAKKLTKKAVKQLKGNRGPAGPAGAPGAPGAPGATGPQGPGGQIVTFDATATSPTPAATPLGTFLGLTLSAACSSSAGEAKLVVNLSTSDGSWAIDFSEIDSGATSGTNSGNIAVPAGTITSPLPLSVTAASGGTTQDSNLTFIQTSPSPGSVTMNFYATTNTSSPTCHFAMQYFPETVTKFTGTPHLTPKATPQSIRKLLHLAG